MIAAIWRLIGPYLVPIGLIAGVLVVGYIGYLNYRVISLKADNKELTTANAQLTVDLQASQNQVFVLAERETQNKDIEAKYDKLRRELKNKQNGPVADVLRFAIDADVVR